MIWKIKGAALRDIIKGIKADKVHKKIYEEMLSDQAKELLINVF